MRNFTFTLICTIAMLSVSNVNAQKDLVNGYVITNNGEKVEGFFNSNELDIYSRLVAFQRTKNSKKI